MTGDWAELLRAVLVVLQTAPPLAVALAVGCAVLGGILGHLSRRLRSLDLEANFHRDDNDTDPGHTEP